MRMHQSSNPLMYDKLINTHMCRRFAEFLTCLCMISPLIYAIVYTTSISQIQHKLEVDSIGIIKPAEVVTFHSLTKSQAEDLGLDPDDYPHVNRTIKLNFNRDAHGEIYFLVGIKDTFQNLGVVRKRDPLSNRVTVYHYRLEKEGGLFPIGTPRLTHDQGISNTALFFEIVGLIVVMAAIIKAAGDNS